MSWQRDVKSKIRELEEYANQLEKMHQAACNELADIAAGLVLTGQPEEWSVSARLQHRAARFLAAERKPSIRRPRWVWP